MARSFPYTYYGHKFWLVPSFDGKGHVVAASGPAFFPHQKGALYADVSEPREMVRIWVAIRQPKRLRGAVPVPLARLGLEKGQDFFATPKSPPRRVDRDPLGED